MWKVLGSFSAVLTLAMLAAAVPANGQTLGDIATKEAARRQVAEKSDRPKVYTNDDLKPTAPPSSGTPAAPSAPATTGAAAQGSAAAKPSDSQAQGEKAPGEEKDETYWRTRMTQLREQLRRNELFRDSLQTRINSLSNDFAARDDPGQRAQLGADRQTAVAELARVTSEIDQINKKIADSEEEARQAGVPAGWLR